MVSPVEEALTDRIVALERRLDLAEQRNHQDYESVKALQQRVTGLEAKNGSLTSKAARSRRFDPETGKEKL